MHLTQNALHQHRLSGLAYLNRHFLKISDQNWPLTLSQLKWSTKFVRCHPLLNKLAFRFDFT